MSTARSLRAPSIPHRSRGVVLRCSAKRLHCAEPTLLCGEHRSAEPHRAQPRPSQGVRPQNRSWGRTLCCPAGSQQSAGVGSREGRSCKRGGCCPTQGWGISAPRCWRPFAGCLQTLPPAHPRSSVHKKCQKKFVHSSNYRIVWFCGFLW